MTWAFDNDLMAEFEDEIGESGVLFWNVLGVWWIHRQHGFIMVSLLNGWWRRS